MRLHFELTKFWGFKVFSYDLPGFHIGFVEKTAPEEWAFYSYHPWRETLFGNGQTREEAVENSGVLDHVQIYKRDYEKLEVKKHETA